MYPKIKLNWQDSKMGKTQELVSTLPVAIGRNLNCLPTKYERQSVNQIILSGSKISRFHAALSFKNRSWTIYDKSKNGILVNNKRVNSSLALSDGDLIQIDTYLITFTQTKTINDDVTQTDFIKEKSVTLTPITEFEQPETTIADVSHEDRWRSWKEYTSNDKWCSCYVESPKGQTPPNCPFCHHPVRKTPIEKKPCFYTYGALPWNAGWDGTCDNCGHRFETKHYYNMGLCTRKASFRPSVIARQTLHDGATVFRGVEIVIEEKNLYGKEPTPTKFKLTLDELETLIASLKGELSICYEQYSWNEDWT